MDGNSAQSAIRGFDFTAAMRRVCLDMTLRLPELAHVDCSRVAIRFCQTRKRVSHGLLASLTPLRFANGETVSRRRGRAYCIESVLDGAGREMLYLLSFYLPRFQNHTLDEKLATILHELWHIGPAFDGDLRRHDGRCYAHGPREKEYHASMHVLAREWLSRDPPPELYAFLACDFRQLKMKHGGVFGARIRTPRLLPAPPDQLKAAS